MIICMLSHCFVSSRWCDGGGAVVRVLQEDGKLTEEGERAFFWQQCSL